MLMNRGFCFRWVMFMDRRYSFGDVNEKVYFSDVNSLPAKSVLAGTKPILFGRYVLKFYVGIVQ